MLSVQEINWDGEYLRVRLQISSQIKNINLIAKDVNSINLNCDITKTNDFLEIMVSNIELKKLKIGEWKLYISYRKRFKNQIIPLSYLNAPLASQFTRHLKPIINKKNTSAVLFINNNHQLEIHVADYLTILSTSFQRVHFSYSISEVEYIDNKICFYTPETLCDYYDEALLVFEGEETNKHVKVELDETQKGFVVKKKDFSKLKSEQSFKGYLIIKMGSLIKIINLNAIALEREIDLNHKYKLDLFNPSEFVFKVKLKEEAYKNQTLRGELSVEDFKIEGQEISFVFNKEAIHFSQDYSFYLKKRRTPDKVELKTESTYLDNNHVRLTLRIDQFQDPLNLKGRWDLFVDIQHSELFSERMRVGSYNLNGLSHFESMFDKIHLTDEVVVAPYLTTDNEYSFVFAQQVDYYKEKYRIFSSLKNVKLSKKGILNLTVEVKSSESFTYDVTKLIVKLRKSDEVREIPVQHVKYEGNKKIVSITTSIDELNLEQFYWDFYMEYKVEESALFSKRLKNTNKLIAKKLKHGAFTSTYTTKEGYLVYPYITRDQSVSLTYRLKGEFESNKHKIIEYLAFLSFKLKLTKNKKNQVWLIHEKLSETAQDNSFYFFKYCYENRPEKDVYYVIKEGSEDVNNLAPYMDRVVYFMSYKHIKLILESKLMISSEAKGHGYAWRVSQGPIRNYVDKKKYVFLQHGVLGLKKVDSTFNYRGANSAELFVVSSEFEKKIVQEHFGYPEKRLIVTGLARWDVLKNKVNERKEIIFMPTWRNWLEEVDEGQFLNSQYYRSYNDLLNSKELVQTLTTNNLTLNFYVHPKFMPYVKNFSSEDSKIKVLQFGQDRINELIMRSHMLITDYSSVAWEMYYLKKPVLFYYFDLPKYMKYQGAYMDIENERFGDMAKTPNELIHLINSYVKNGFKENPTYAEKREEYFKYVDNLNSERIFSEIVSREK
ncbi:CDP-glycerol glycerophosphotransferase family protein [Alkalihalobacillus sp. NPDC078783]